MAALARAVCNACSLPVAIVYGLRLCSTSGPKAGGSCFHVHCVEVDRSDPLSRALCQLRTTSEVRRSRERAFESPWVSALHCADDSNGPSVWRGLRLPKRWEDVKRALARSDLATSELPQRALSETLRSRHNVGAEIGRRPNAKGVVASPMRCLRPLNS
mgnify:CR=1 FL=1